MKYRNLLTASALSVIMLATTTTVKAQQDTLQPQNNTEMNSYTYTPELYQRGGSTTGMRLFPNPARGEANIYINSIKERDNGEVVIYNTSGRAVYKNTIQTGNNRIDLGNLEAGIYVVKVFTKDRFNYSQQLIVSR